MSVPRLSTALSRDQTTGHVSVGLDGQAVVERIVRTMLFYPQQSLMKELQRAILDPNFSSMDNKVLNSLSPLAKSYVCTYCNTYNIYWTEAILGIDKFATTEEKFAATTQLPHDEALSDEYGNFIEFLESISMLTVDDICKRNNLAWLVEKLKEHMSLRLEDAANNDKYIMKLWIHFYDDEVNVNTDDTDVTQRKWDRNDEDRISQRKELYWLLYRSSPNAKPVSWLVYHEIVIVAEDVVRRMECRNDDKRW